MRSITIDFPGQGISALWFARMPPTDQTQCYVFGDFISTRFPLYSFSYKSIKCQSYCGLIQTKLYDFVAGFGTKALLILWSLTYYKINSKAKYL